MKSGIYKITNTVNNKYYIGSSKNIRRRMGFHKDYLNKEKHHNIHLQQSWNKYGEKSFKFTVIEYIHKDKLEEVEQVYLDNGDWENMYNMERKAYGGGASTLEQELLLLDIDGRVLERYQSGTILNEELDLFPQQLNYKYINKNLIVRNCYRIVTPEFYMYNKEVIISWRKQKNKITVDFENNVYFSYNRATNKLHVERSMESMGILYNITRERVRQKLNKIGYRSSKKGTYNPYKISFFNQKGIIKFKNMLIHPQKDLKPLTDDLINYYIYHNIRQDAKETLLTGALKLLKSKKII